MVHKLFEKFLDDPSQYRASEQYWKQLVRDAADSLGQMGEWEPWIPRQYANGTPIELDGNPIFDGRSLKLNRAFRIMQHPAVGDDIEIAAWVKIYEEEYSELPREELVINLSPSEESAQIARYLLMKWMSPATSANEMQRWIRDHAASDKEDGRIQLCL